MKQENQERGQGDDQEKHGRKGDKEVTRKKGVTWKEVERTIKDRENWKALWDLLYTGR